MSSETVFDYPAKQHERRHGPLGYTDYQSYKPWLRDEFTFRCVYCLWRETWCADGDGSFGVDHLRPRSSYPQGIVDYTNLAYACCRCNSVKQDADLPLHPCEQGWSSHLAIAPDGAMRSMSSAGEQTIEICRLNRPLLIEARRRMMQLLRVLSGLGNESALTLMQEYLGFPANLPALALLIPPGGNARPGGIQESCFERRNRGELSETY